jgi:hypothetical protein
MWDLDARYTWWIEGDVGVTADARLCYCQPELYYK